MVVGIAGKTGAGKNRVAELLERRGWRTLDLDRVAHRALAVLADRLEGELGPGLKDETGKVDRKELGQRVFSDPARLALLEKITYPWIEKETQKWLAEEPHTPAALHAINLHKTDLVERFDAIIWVDAPAYLRRRRVSARDGRPIRELKGRFRSQKGLGPGLFRDRGLTTFVVVNDAGPEILERQVSEALTAVEALPLTRG